MKDFIITWTSGTVLMAILLFIVAAFGFWSFNPADWPLAGRLVVSCGWFIFVLYTGVIGLRNLSDEE